MNSAQRAAVVVRYAYDAWGNILSMTGPMAYTNPIRYRGYYYDDETGWYWLQTRYYNPTWCRFINADCLFIAGEDVINGSNMYAYCNGNPVMNFDPTGMATSGWGVLGEALIITFYILADAIEIGRELLFPLLQGFLETEIFEFAAIIYGEGGTCVTAEQYAIAFSIRNRVEKISYYPNNYHSVLSQKGQYDAYEGNAFNAAMKYYLGTSSPSSDAKGKMLKCLAIALYVYYYDDSFYYSFLHRDNSLGASAFNSNGYFPPYHIKANTPSSWHHDFYIFVG